MVIVNTAQAEQWNTGDGVAHWVGNQARYDRMHAPFTAMIIEAAGLRPGTDVLDVGCRPGSKTALDLTAAAVTGHQLFLAGRHLPASESAGSAASQDRAAGHELVTEGQPPAPGYFVFDAVLNRKQHDLLDVESSARPLPAAEFLDRRGRGAVVIDARDPYEFAAAHLRGSLNVPADGRFAERAGMVTEPGSEILVIAPPGGEQEVITRLGRIGFDTVTGYLSEPEAAFLAVPGEVDQASRLTASDLRETLGRDRPPVVLDVRNAAERAEGAIDGSLHIPLAELPRRLAEVPSGTPVVVYCAAGTRSSIAASLLRRAGHRDVSDLIGGEAAWRLSLTPAQGN